MEVSQRQRILNAPSLGSHGNVPGREAMLAIMEAGLRAADPYSGAYQLLRVEGRRLIVGQPEFVPAGAPYADEQVYDLDQIDRVFVFGAGKGIQRIAKAIEDALGDRLTGGHVIDKQGSPLICERIGVTFGAHPVPDEQCVQGCRRILEMARELTSRDLVFAVCSNGVSSLLTLPVQGVSLEDVRRTTRIMQIQRGAPTFDLNPVRNHIDQLKGGRLSRYLQPAKTVHILAYDPHDYEYLMTENIWLHSLPEASTFDYAVAMLHKWDAWDAVPESVRAHLLEADPTKETVKRDEFERMGAPIYGIMPRMLGMLPTAKRKAEELGFNALLMTTWLQAEASQAAQVMASFALCAEKHGQPIEPPCAFINGGELLVTVGEESGMGGRNQEWACSAALKLAGSPHIVMGSVDSDGTDGPGHQFSDGGKDIPVFAGGIVDGQTAQRAQDLGVDLWDALRRHDTSPALHRLGDGIIASYNISLTDLTVTLVMDRGVNPNFPR